MDTPNKRARHSSPAEAHGEQDFVSFNDDALQAAQYGFDNDPQTSQQTNSPPRGPRQQYKDLRGQPWFDRKHAQDRPKSKHALPGHEPWVLVKTKYGRRFVHNTQTKESFWRFPGNVAAAVREFDQWERSQEEKEKNAKWAEQELAKMREHSKAEEVNAKADGEERRSRRRRSESLQREDEEAMMAELAAEAEHAEEQDVKEIIRTLEPVVGDVGYDSEGSYEYVEVTDSEGEGGGDDDEDGAGDGRQGGRDDDVPMDEVPADEDPVEFGEDDIAYQLAAMGQDYGLDPGEYGDGQDYEGSEEWDEEAQGLPIPDEDAANLFRDMLDDHRISPFTPWEKLISDEGENSIINDDRYTILPNMKTRREVWDAWTKDTAAKIKEVRATMEKKDPRIPYLAFLGHKATPKLYWPEFKRKYKREPELTTRNLDDKAREKLYRDHINRLKLPESSREADLLTLLKSVPLRQLNRDSDPDNLPQQLLSHLHYVSLGASTRDRIVSQHIASLPSAPEGEDAEADEQRAEAEKKRQERRRREDALAERQRQVDEERRKTEKEERFARRSLLEEKRELQRAMKVGSRG